MFFTKIVIIHFILCLRQRKPSMSEAFCFQVCPSVSESVGLSVTKILWTPYLKKQLMEFHQILVTNVFGFIDLLIRFWSQKVKSQGHRKRKAGEYNIFATIGANFTKIRSHIYVSLETYWLGFLVKRSKVKVTAGRCMTVDGSPSSSI